MAEWWTLHSRINSLLLFRRNMTDKTDEQIHLSQSRWMSLADHKANSDSTFKGILAES